MSTLHRDGAGKKKKGLSMEEKVVKVEHWFTTHTEPYTLKELQSLIPKATGVLYQSIEECLELLVAEQRVQQDRVGVHTLFWLFPRTPTQEQQQQQQRQQGDNRAAHQTEGGARAQAVLLAACHDIHALRTRRETCAQTRAELDEALALCQSEARSESAAHAACEAAERSLTRTRATLQATLRGGRARYDAGLIAPLCKAAAVAAEAARRWAENYDCVEHYCVSALGLRASEVRRALHIPSEMDESEAAEVMSEAEAEAEASVSAAHESMLVSAACLTASSSAAAVAAMTCSEDDVSVRGESAAPAEGNVVHVDSEAERASCEQPCRACTREDAEPAAAASTRGSEAEEDVVARADAEEEAAAAATGTEQVVIDTRKRSGSKSAESASDEGVTYQSHDEEDCVEVVPLDSHRNVGGTRAQACASSSTARKKRRRR